jgi:drug/metabolite transporter (DMT)-like permease
VSSRTVLDRLSRLPIDLILFLVSLIWGVNYTIIKVALREFDPLAFNGLRFLLALLTVLVVVRGNAPSLRMPAANMRRLILLGILGNTVYQMLFIHGIVRTTASHAAIIMASTPMLVALIARLGGREWISARGWVGVALAVLGIVVLLAARPAGTLGGGDLVGDLFILAGAVTWASYSVAAARALRAAPLSGTLVTFLAGAPPIVLLSLPGLLRQDWGAITLVGWSGAVFSGVVAIGLGYLGWNKGLSTVGGTSTAVYSNLNPIIAAAVAWLFLGEHLTLVQVAGAALALFGVALTRLGTTTRTPVTGPGAQAAS